MSAASEVPDPLEGPAVHEDRRPRVAGETERIAAGISAGKVAYVLDAAASRIERLASQFTRWGLPWYAGPEDVNDLDDWPGVDEGDGDWRVLVQPSPISDGAPEPHEFNLDRHGALACVGGMYVADGVAPTFARYAAVMGPQITGALVAALREAAAAARSGARPDRDPVLRHLVELAVEIVHREDPRNGDI